MLRTFFRLSDLDFEKLMAVYEEGNRENGAELYPDLEAGEALRRAEADFYSYLREDFFRQKGAFYCVWEEGGLYLSALRLEPFEDGLLLEALETQPDHRRKGYAGKLIRAMQAYLEKGPVYSHVHKRNRASLAAHSANGFTVISDFARYVDGTVTGSSHTLCWK